MATATNPELAQETPWISNDLELQPPTKDSLRRIRSDYKSFVAEELQGIYCIPSEDIITKYHALIVGPFDTPYEGGFFLFTIIFPPDYPSRAPFVKFEGTGGGQVRFNPNLYRNGKVCLSILGTKGGDNDWNPTQNLTSILLSIQVRYKLIMIVEGNKLTLSFLLKVHIKR